MSEVLAVLAVALLSVVFVLTHRNRGCPGAHACEDADGLGRCPGCPGEREERRTSRA